MLYLHSLSVMSGSHCMIDCHIYGYLIYLSQCPIIHATPSRAKSRGVEKRGDAIGKALPARGGHVFILASRRRLCTKSRLLSHSAMSRRPQQPPIDTTQPDVEEEEALSGAEEGDEVMEDAQEDGYSTCAFSFTTSTPLSLAFVFSMYSCESRTRRGRYSNIHVQARPPPRRR